ncbi:MAG: YbaN family protein [Candidatus Zambryskibacteria bacterium]|nr:YbaN family protein [Candidatus Zambryskibacteria bacterium]
MCVIITFSNFKKSVIVVKRLILLALGHIFFAVGLIGIFVPLLPSTPFMLLACWCYGKSSARFHQMIENNRYFKEAIKNWRENGSISLGSKLMAAIMLAVSLGYSIIAVESNALKLTFTSFIFIVVWYILSRPSPYQDRGGKS